MEKRRTSRWAAPDDDLSVSPKRVVEGGIALWPRIGLETQDDGGACVAGEIETVAAPDGVGFIFVEPFLAVYKEAKGCAIGEMGTGEALAHRNGELQHDLLSRREMQPEGLIGVSGAASPNKKEQKGGLAVLGTKWLTGNAGVFGKKAAPPDRHGASAAIVIAIGNLIKPNIVKRRNAAG